MKDFSSDFYDTKITSFTEGKGKIPTNIEMIKANDFWSHSNKGKGITIAVIDTGCDYNHNDLRNNIIDGKNFTEDDNGDEDNFTDYAGHGTHVAGTIAASGGEDGIYGVAPEANLIILKAIGKNERFTPSWTPIRIIKAINYAIQKKADIISMSLGWPKDFIELHEVIKRAVENDILFVCAAANDGDGKSETAEISYPAYYNEVISVGAADYTRGIAYFSNSNKQVDLVAPGVGIYSTTPNNKHDYLDGTSMAAPHVAGALALIKNWSTYQFERVLSEPELYSQLIRRTIPLGNSKKLEGNGFLYLPAVELLEKYLQQKDINTLFIKQDQPLITKNGYNSSFLGEDFEIPLPELIGETKQIALNGGEVYSFTNYSVVMNSDTRFAIYSVCNVDESQKKPIARSDKWHYSDLINRENQNGNEFYRDAQLDRGHLTRRKDVCWGTYEQAKKGNDDSFCWANICLQDHDFNTKDWNIFENWILDDLEGKSTQLKLSIFTGPINMMNDRSYCVSSDKKRCAKIPAGFWKVITYVDKNKELRCLSFLGKQDDFWNDDIGKRLIRNTVYQVPLNLISKLTLIEFDSKLYNSNPLYYWENQFTVNRNIQTPQLNAIENNSDVIYDMQDINKDI